MRNVVCTSDAPNVIGPYSQAVKGGGFIFVSGQLGLNPATQQIIGGDARQQTERALQNIAAILKAVGSNLDKVLRCGVFLKLGFGTFLAAGQGEHGDVHVFGQGRHVAGGRESLCGSGRGCGYTVRRSNRE